jgi:ABC-type spermidine/putrescine transport system permease subunit II
MVHFQLVGLLMKKERIPFSPILVGTSVGLLLGVVLVALSSRLIESLDVLTLVTFLLGGIGVGLGLYLVYIRLPYSGMVLLIAGVIVLACAILLLV